MCLIVSVTKSHFYTFLFFLLPLLYYLSLPVSVGDLAWWTAYGNYFLSHGQLLVKDIYSILPTAELVYPTLLAVIYGLLDFIGGLALVSLLHKLVFLLTLLVIYRTSLGKMNAPFSRSTIFWILVSFSGIFIYCIDRPALIVLLFLVSANRLIESETEFNHVFFLNLAGFLILWVNMHGSWPLLLLMLGWKMLFRKNTLQQAAYFAGLTAVSLLNPFGWKVWPYMLDTAVKSKARGIDEWNVLNLHDYFPQGIIFLITVMIFLFVVRKNFRRDMLSSPIFVLLILGFTAMRNTGLFHLVLLPFLYKFNLLKEDTSVQTRKTFNLVFAAALFLLCVLQLPWLKQFALLPASKARIFDELAPVAFVNAIQRSGSSAAIFNDWEYGSYLMYSLPNKILIDSRNIIYSDADFSRYSSIVAGDDSWQNFMRENQIGFILLNRKLRPVLINKINNSLEWNLLFEDENSVLYQINTHSRP